MKFKNKNLIIIFAIIAVSAITFWPLTKSFFQQDEWAIFGNVIYSSQQYENILGVILPFSGISHFVPFTRLLTKITFDLFQLQFIYYALFAIFLHSFNSLLVYYLSFLLVRNRLMSLISALFFASSSISHQATTWIATNVGTEGSTVFLLISLIFISKFLFHQKKYFFLILSLVFWLISLGFKENGIFLLAFYPLLWLIAKKKFDIYRFLKDVLPFFIAFIGYLILRIVIHFTSLPPAGVEQLSQPNIIVYFFRIIVFPIRALVQSIIPERILLHLSNMIIHLAYPQFLVDGKIPDPYITQSVAMDIINLFFAFLFLSGIFMYSITSKQKEYKKAIIFSFLLIMFSVMPLILTPGKVGFSSLFETRNLYITLVGSSIIIALAIVQSIHKLLNKVKKKEYFYIVVGGVTFFFVLFHVKFIWNDLKIINQRSNIRKNVLQQIYDKYPVLPEKTIIYVESDTTYYGLPESEKILPFQSGLGQTLLIWYSVHGELFPSCFFIPQDDYLYNIYSQGYKECKSRGFGYFRKMDDLKKAIKDNGIMPSEVIGFSYISEQNNLIDITENIKKESQN